MFILITSGRAAGHVYHLTEVAAHDEVGPATGVTGDRIICDDADFYRDGVRAGDSFVLIGNTSGCASFPANFGNTDFHGPPDTADSQRLARQTVLDAVDNDFSWTAVFSRSRDLGATQPATSGPRAPVRVDVLVFHRYQTEQSPAKNKAAIEHRVTYVLPPAN